MITAFVILMTWTQSPDAALLTMSTVPAQTCVSMAQIASAEPSTIRAECVSDETRAEYYFMKSDCGDILGDSDEYTSFFMCKKAPKKS